MVIRRKMFIIIVSAFSGILIIFALSGFLLLRGFSSVEDQDVRENVLRASGVFTSAIDNLGVKVHDWSAWDDTYDFIRDHNQEYVRSNLDPESLQSLGINMIVFVDRDYNIVKSVRISTTTLKTSPLPPGLLPYLKAGSPLIQYKDLDGVKQGVIDLPEGLLMIVARPIETSKRTGPMRGTIFFAKFVDQPFVDGLSETIDFPLTIESYASADAGSDFEVAKQSFMQSNSTAVIPTDQDTIAGYTVIAGVDTQPAMILRATMDRHTLALGKKTVYSYFAFVLLTLVIISVGMWFLIDKFVLSRMIQLTARVAASSPKNKKGIELPGNDEFSKLAQVINALTAKLQKSLRDLSEAKAKDDALLASIGDGLMAVGTDGRIVLVNDAFEKIMGWKLSEVQGKKLIDVVTVTDEQGKVAPPAKRLIEATLQKEIKTVTHASQFFTRKDGTVFPVSVTVSPIIAGGVFLGAVEVFRDITKEQEVDKAKTEFVSLASHQLRTPLTSINWYTEMLMAGDAGKITAHQKKYLKEIYNGNQRMVELVNSLLSVSRLELGTFVFEPQPTNVVEVTKDSIKEQEQDAAVRKIELSSVFAKDLPLIPTDPKLLRMVVQNLLSNAIKYTPEEGKITIALALDAQKEHVVLAVADTGYGIPKNQQDRIFSKLFRADNARAKEVEGTGLGLYIVKSVVEHAGGSVWFESEINKGTTFYVALPVKERGILTDI
jgi:PAS domain S-box-containing protein